MKKSMCIAFLGGDERQIYAAKAMRNICDEVLTWGLGSPTEGLKACTEAIDAVGRSDAIILPISVTKDGQRLNCPLGRDARLELSELSHMLPKSTPILGGILPKPLIEQFLKDGIRYINYFEREELQIKNALLTAEGALSLAITETPISILNSNIAVLGYGRIGKFLSDILRKMGANVTVFARKPVDLATAQMHGYSTCSFQEDISKMLTNQFDIIYNTAPYLLINESILSQMRHDSIIFDLASAPGGIDFDSAQRHGIRAISAPGLPGKFSPKSAGIIVAETIVHLLNEEESFT